MPPSANLRPYGVGSLICKWRLARRLVCPLPRRSCNPILADAANASFYQPRRSIAGGAWTAAPGRSSQSASPCKLNAAAASHYRCGARLDRLLQGRQCLQLKLLSSTEQGPNRQTMKPVTIPMKTKFPRPRDNEPFAWGLSGPEPVEIWERFSPAYVSIAE